VEQNITETTRLLVVSRESAVLRPLWSIAEPNGWHVEVAVSAWDAIERVQSVEAPHLMVLDLPRSDGDRLHILRWLRRFRPDLPVIVVCCSEHMEHNREAIRMGAQEVLILPLDEAQLESVISRHLAPPENEADEITNEDIEQVGPDSYFVSASPATQKLRAQIQLLAEADVPVLILGEHGSGHDTAARLIHKHSARCGFKFVSVNCAESPRDLLEVQLFGQRQTHANNGSRTSPTKFESGKSTMFLDEITEMPLGAQAKLMHLLQDNPSRPGGDKAPSGGVRVLAATSANLEHALADRKLREDLYYRLSAYSVQLPPLRQRKTEIPALLRHSMHHLARYYGLPPRELPPALMEACERYSWPGNLKELECFVRRYLVAGDTGLAFSELESTLVKSSAPDVRKWTSPNPTNNIADENPLGPRSLKSLIHTIKCEAEKNAIVSVLQRTHWNRKAAARLLQVSYRTLLYKIEQYHLRASDTFLSPLELDKLSVELPTRVVEEHELDPENSWKQLPRSKP